MYETGIRMCASRLPGIYTTDLPTGRPMIVITKAERILGL